MASALISVLLLQQFLSAVLGKGGYLSTILGRAVGAAHVPWTMAGLLLIATLVTAAFGYWGAITMQRATQVLELGLMDRLIRHLLTLSVEYFHQRTHGDLIQTLRQDVIQLRTLVSSVASVIMDGILASGMVCVLIWLSPSLVFWGLVLIPLVLGPVLVYVSKHLRALSRITRVSGYVLFDVILQILEGIRVIKAYQAEETEAVGGIEKGKVFFKSLMKAVQVRAFGTVLLESAGGLSFVLVIAVGTLKVARGNLSWPSLLSFAMASRALFAPILNLYLDYLNIPTYRASMDRINELLNTKPKVVDRPNALRLTAGPRHIVFENVGFAYGAAPVLHGISFEVQAGETIGIVGPSGTGKSTLLNLVVRYYDPTSGHVLFDGIDLRDFCMADIFEKIAIVTQDPFLFATSVWENIRCGRSGASDDEVMEAAQGASIHEEILSLPDGYETQIGAGGRELSRGQAQRINVARALLKSAPILLLDEATSSLDSVAEAEVQNSIDRLMQGRTSFVVAHRLSTLRNANRILVLDVGRCVAFGPHEELLRDCALYRQLWDLQGISLSPAPKASAAAKIAYESDLVEGIGPDR